MIIPSIVSCGKSYIVRCDTPNIIACNETACHVGMILASEASKKPRKKISSTIGASIVVVMHVRKYDATVGYMMRDIPSMVRYPLPRKRSATLQDNKGGGTLRIQ